MGFIYFPITMFAMGIILIFINFGHIDKITRIIFLKNGSLCSEPGYLSGPFVLYSVLYWQLSGLYHKIPIGYWQKSVAAILLSFGTVQAAVRTTLIAKVNRLISGGCRETSVGYWFLFIEPGLTSVGFRWMDFGIINWIRISFKLATGADFKNIVKQEITVFLMRVLLNKEKDKFGGMIKLFEF